MKIKYIVPLLAAGMLFTLTGCSDGNASKIESQRKSGIEAMNNGQYEDAVKSFDSAYALCDEKMPKTKVDLALYKAACELNLEDYDSLIAVCDQILELQENGDAYYLRGLAYMKQGDEEKAGADFDQASVLNSTDYQMFLNIYTQYEAISKSAVGDKYIQKALTIPNSTTEDYYQKGCIYYYLGEYSEVLDELAVPVEQKDENSMVLMGQAYLSLNDSVRARSIFQQYLEEFPDSARAYNGLALCDLADKAYDTALSDIGTGLALKPEAEIRRELLYNEIVAYEKKLDFDTAKIKAEPFMEEFPDDADGQREVDFLSTR